MEVILFQASSYLAAAVIAMLWTARSGLSSIFRHRGAGILIDPLLGLGRAEIKNFNILQNSVSS
jgi:CPA2 family monovalent cation:H+ antiporter-2